MITFNIKAKDFMQAALLEEFLNKNSIGFKCSFDSRPEPKQKRSRRVTDLTPEDVATIEKLCNKHKAWPVSRIQRHYKLGCSNAVVHRIRAGTHPVQVRARANGS